VATSGRNQGYAKGGLELIPPHFLSGIGGGWEGTIMGQIIYCVSLVAIWLCSTATTICLLNFGALGLVLIASAGFSFFFSSVALVQEFVEWRRHTEALPLKRLLLPPAS
jgi:hypothetical protein